MNENSNIIDFEKIKNDVLNTKNNLSSKEDDKKRLSPEIRDKVIDTLLDIRLTLCIKKLQKPTISKEELNKIVNESLEKAKDEKVSTEIDKVFSEYLDSKDKNNKDNNLDNKELSVNDMEKIINGEMKSSSFVDQGNEKGTTLIKKDNHFNSANDSTNQAA